MRQLARVSLETAAGWDVLAARSGDEALRCAATQSPEAILLDVVMPDMDGPATLVELKAAPETRDIPVIFVTAKDRPDERTWLQSLGCAGVIAKPFEMRELAGRVSEILGWDA